jgi:hypothetical protein
VPKLWIAAVRSVRRCPLTRFEEPMAEEKKKAKIDLKARLGKTTQTGMTAVPLPVPGPSPSSNPSAPPAPTSSDGGVPPPAIPVPSPSVRPSGGGIAPPPGISPGIPLPPFAQARQAREPAQKPTAAQQTIKVEVGEEIHQERKKASRTAALYAGIAAIVGLAAGFAIGGAQERSARGNVAVKTAGDLEKEVKASNDKIKELGEKLQEAAEKLGKKEFPADLVTALGGINIPFDAGNLEKPGVGSMGKTLKPLLKYTKDVQELNEDKDQLKNVLTALQPQAEKAWKEEKEPLVNYSVVFHPEGGKGMIADLIPNKDPFKLGADWPKTYKVTKTEMQQGQARAVDKDAKRWDKGDLTGSDLIAIPVSPQTTSFLADKVVPQLRLKIIEQIEVIAGKNKDTPQETAGLLKEGDDLANELHKLALAK